MGNKAKANPHVKTPPTIKVRTLSAQVAQTDYDRYEQLAKLRGLSVSAFVYEAMHVLYPAELYDEQRASLHEQAAAEAAPSAPPDDGVRSVMGFGLHESAGLDDGGVMALEDGLAAAFGVLDGRDAPAAPRVSLPQAPGGPPVRNDLHPCRFLDINPPPNITRVDCQGACRAQHNRPCHWPANVAAQCGTYQPLRTGPHVGR